VQLLDLGWVWDDELNYWWKDMQMYTFWKLQSLKNMFFTQQRTSECFPIVLIQIWNDAYILQYKSPVRQAEGKKHLGLNVLLLIKYLRCYWNLSSIFFWKYCFSFGDKADGRRRENLVIRLQIGPSSRKKTSAPSLDRQRNELKVMSQSYSAFKTVSNLFYISLVF